MKEDILKEWAIKHAVEIKLVKELGEKIGYANIMGISSSLWQMDLEEKHQAKAGSAFIPTVKECMLPHEAVKAIEEQQRRIESIKKILNG
jgi:hypothetical protein